MTIYKLYVKTHNKTGLKYLGFTKSTDPHKYTGSGLHWVRHLKKHGSDYTTEILKECQDHSAVKFWGEYYSTLWDIVKSKKWANIRPETGSGVDPVFASKNNSKRIKDGTHNFLNGEVQRKNNLERVSNGTHHWLSGELQRISTNRRLADGTHPFQTDWVCEYCGKIGKNKAMYNRWHNGKCKTNK